MKKVILVVFMVPYLASAQVIDDFETGNLKSWLQNDYDRWKADTISPLSGRFSLHHVFDNPDAGNDRIAIPLKNLHPDEGTTRWSFTLRHGYDPSSSNNWMVFLLSQSGLESMTPAACSGAFAIGVNITGSDDSLRLVRISNGIVTIVTNCGINWQTGIGMAAPVKINVERSSSGAWKVDVYRKDGELIKSSTAFDAEMFVPAWFGISYKYSSTRDRLLWIDDVSITGAFYSDTVPPAVNKLTVTGRNSLLVGFTEEPAEGTIVPGIFKLNGGEVAIKAEKNDPLSYTLTFGIPFINRKSNTLLITRICDKSGNCSEMISGDFLPVWAELGDVVITEIMADPVPSVSLPEAEFIEVANRTDFRYDLKGWTLETEDQVYKFPDCIVGPHEILLLTHRNHVSMFSSFGRSAGFTSFPILPDAGKLICLRDSTGALIHGVEYSSDWYNNDLKSEGGWSLEIIDAGSPFFYEGNWTGSSSKKGGTPGSVNSVTKNNHDPVFEGLLNVFPEDSNAVSITFSEPVPVFSEMMKKLEISGKVPLNVTPSDKLFRSFMITTAEKLTVRQEYDIVIPEDLADFAGNRIMTKKAIFGLTEAAEKGDVLFNEILFNPLPGSADYIEFFNASDRAIDASRLFLVSVDDETGDTSDLYRVSDIRRCLMPSSYYAITEEKDNIAGSYASGDPECIFSSGELPSMADDKGHLILLNRELAVIDEVIYSEKMHSTLLSSAEGVSLEKSSAIHGSSKSWYSAAESSGWGTPGAENSIAAEFPESGEQVVLSSSRITPDGDGLEDILSIKLSFPENGNVISVTAFDEAGNLVRKVAVNVLSGPESIILWDGTSEDGSPVRNGIYVILITSFNETGKSARWKKVCTVIR